MKYPRQMITGYLQSSDKYIFSSKVVTTLCGILLVHYNTYSQIYSTKWSLIKYAKSSRASSNDMPRGNIFATPLKNLKYKTFNQEAAADSFETTVSEIHLIIKRYPSLSTVGNPIQFQEILLLSGQTTTKLTSMTCLP
jgi:septation ring formation regulator EzrA